MVASHWRKIAAEDFQLSVVLGIDDSPRMFEGEVLGLVKPNSD